MSVANGARLTTTSGSGSFQVNYGPSSSAPNKVVLSNYIANIVPQTYAQWAAGLDPAKAGPSDDADGDGTENLEAYYRGYPATSGSGYAKPTAVAIENGMLNVTIRSPKTATGVAVSSTVTEDFNGSAAGPTPVLVDQTPTLNIFQVSVPANQPSLFVNLIIELQ